MEKCVRKAVLDDALELAPKMRKLDRQEIQDMTWEKYTPARWKSLLDNAIDKTMENFKSTRGGVLPI